MSEKQKRTCRYGHGELKLEPNRWGLIGIDIQKAPDTNQVISSFNPLHFALKIHACPVCGYIELADFDPLTEMN